MISESILHTELYSLMPICIMLRSIIQCMSFIIVAVSPVNPTSMQQGGVGEKILKHIHLAMA